jgi:hypothetical protein
MLANKILFRCSSLGHLMVEPRSKSETLSESTKTHLVDVYVRHKYNRFTDINSKYLNKGNDVEEDSITLVSRLTKTFLKKNEQQLSNDFVCGTPDIYIGESIDKAEIIRDTKSSWDAFTFFRAKHKELNKLYYWQGQGYCWLTGASKFFIDYCLNNTPYHIVEGELRKESYNHLGGDTPAWIELQIISNHVYDKKTFEEYINIRGISVSDDNAKAIHSSFVEIPINERHFAFEVERNDTDIERLKERIKEAREFIINDLNK